ncbi:hypothetical protein VULLAG_LOCUS16113 [Vulpes lagopus]
MPAGGRGTAEGSEEREHRLFRAATRGSARIEGQKSEGRFWAFQREVSPHASQVHSSLLIIHAWMPVSYVAALHSTDYSAPAVPSQGEGPAEGRAHQHPRPAPRRPGTVPPSCSHRSRTWRLRVFVQD